MLSELLKPRVLYVILASDDPIHELDLSMQRHTWLKTMPENSQPIILRGHDKPEYSFDGETLYVPCHESYNNILRKTILGLNWISDNVDFDLLIRTNVSTYYDPDRVDHVLRRIQLQALEFGGFLERSKFRLTEKSEFESFVTGTGIYLTKLSVVELAALDPDKFEGTPEDLSISRYLQKKNAKMISFPRINLHSTHILLPGFQTRLKSSEISELASKRFNALFQFYSASTVLGKTISYLRATRLELLHINLNSFHLKFYVLRNYYICRLNLSRILIK